MARADSPGGTDSTIPDDDLQRMIDRVGASVAVLDGSGLIRAVNTEWVRFAGENGDPTGAATGAGTNYLGACDVNDPVDGDFARRAVAGITAVLRREAARFSLEYPCHSPRVERWFVLLVAPFGETGAVVTHIDVSDDHRRTEDPAAVDVTMRHVSMPPGSSVGRPRRPSRAVRLHAGRRPRPRSRRGRLGSGADS